MPIKMLRYSQLIHKTTGQALPPSGHEVFKVKFIDADGEKKTGFYKPIGKTYPRLLAKISVAVSVLMRMSAGSRVAEDRLVLDDAGRIVGTISIALPNYEPMLGRSESYPTDSHKQELGCPSVPILLEYNMAELLAFAWMSKDDDAHPGNVSLHGLIDHDMRDYQRTSIIKGPRLINGIFNEKALALKSCDLDNFPIIEGRTHWPANILPSNLNINKQYQAYAAFRDLAKNPVLWTKNGEVSFQDQLFHALLKGLIVYDPDILSIRLIEHLGDFPLDFLEIGQKKSSKLSAAYPELFNKKTNSLPFVDYMLAVAKQEDDELYRAVVFYQGCERNLSGVSVISFRQYLQNRPSAFHQIIKWAEQQNSLMDTAWQKYKQQEKQQCAEQVVTELSQITSKLHNAPLDTHYIEPNQHYNLLKLKQRYHQVWRDTQLPIIKEILFQARSLSRKLQNKLLEDPEELTLPNLSAMTINDKNLTKAWQLIDEDMEIDLLEMTSEQVNNLRCGLKKLNCFIKELMRHTKQYYLLESINLTIEDNLIFCKAIDKVMETYENTICKDLEGVPFFARNFENIIQALQQCYGDFHFQRHLLTNDVNLERKTQYDYAMILKRKHTEDEIVAFGLKTLFDWANNVTPEVFNAAIFEVIHWHYDQPNMRLLSYRTRATEVLEYLKISTMDGANKLAYILSSGGKKNTSLNTMLIKHLMPLVLKDTIAMIDINLMSVIQACDRDKFDVTLYTECAMAYAKSNPRFTHIYADSNKTRFSVTLYRWIGQLKTPQLKSLINKSLQEYEPSYCTTLFRNKKRGWEIRRYLNDKNLTNNQLILSLIFSKGETKSTSFNTLLFKHLWEQMQGSIYQNNADKSDSDFKWILELNFKHHAKYFLNALMLYAQHKVNNITTSGREMNGSIKMFMA